MVCLRLSRVTVAIGVVLGLVLLTMGTAWANPGPPFDATIGDPGAYTVAETATTELHNSATWYCYQWDVTFNGSPWVLNNFGDALADQGVMGFVVYDTNATALTLESSSTSLSDWGLSPGSEPTIAAEWQSDDGPTTDIPYMGSATFNACFDMPLTDDYEARLTSVHIRAPSWTGFVNNTPELPVAWLLGLSVGLLGLLGRRRKSA